MNQLTHPGPNDFWFVPLGGTGEIGMNLSLYGHDDHWLMVDCGISFFDQVDPNGFMQSQIIMPDIEFAKRVKDKIVALIVTHAHEDHLGAIPYLWPEIGCPIYATEFTRHVLTNKLLRSDCPAPIFDITPGQTLELKPFSLDAVAMTHSTPETFGFRVGTSVGKVFHTADWKLDPDPVIGEPANEQTYRSLGPLLAVISDSTNALEPTRAVSEAAVFAGLKSIVEDAPGRVVASCFASNIARLQTLGRIAKQTGRYLGLLGHSLFVMFEAARKAGYLLEDFEVFDTAELAYLPQEEVLLIATGSQGQPGSALHRLATDSHPDINLDPSDQIILSSKTIPGNERSIEILLNYFADLNITVWQAETSNLPLHASGHGGQPELTDLFEWTKPTAVIPVHGEPEHLSTSANLARQVGIERQLVGQNGDLFDLGRSSVVPNSVPSGVLTTDSYGRLIPFDPASKQA